MNDLYLISASLLLLAASFVPKGNRQAFMNFFGGTTTSFGGTTTSQPVEDSIDFDREKPQISTSPVLTKKPFTLPKNRKLTSQEVLSLAHHISEKYKINSTVSQDLTIIAYIESSFRPWVERDEGFDRSTGLMQTLLGTANDMYNKGYTAFGKPTRDSLKDPLESMYFGAAYLQWLKLNYSQWGYNYGNWEEFFIRSYNGGAGWQKTPNGAKNTAAYLKKFKAAKAKLNLPNVIFNA